MDFFKILEKVKRVDASLIFYSLLNRIPIIVLGDNTQEIDDFLIELSELIHFRKELVFYTDFISLTEYNELIQNESIDYNSQRTHIRCPCNVALKALNNFESYVSWLIELIFPCKKIKKINPYKILKNISLFLYRKDKKEPPSN